MTMTSMQMTPEEAKKEYGPVDGDSMLGSDPDLPKYPYCLKLYLDDEVLAKLGMATLPAVGAKMTMMAVVEITGTSERQNQKGTSQCLDLQITDMALGAGPDKTPAQGLYSASNMKP